MNASTFCTFALMPLLLAASQLSAENMTTACPKATDEAWFGAPIPASGYDSSIPDCGMTAAILSEYSRACQREVDKAAKELFGDLVL